MTTKPRGRTTGNTCSEVRRLNRDVTTPTDVAGRGAFMTVSDPPLPSTHCCWLLGQLWATTPNIYNLMPVAWDSPSHTPTSVLVLAPKSIPVIPSGFFWSLARHTASWLQTWKGREVCSALLIFGCPQSEIKILVPQETHHNLCLISAKTVGAVHCISTSTHLSSLAIPAPVPRQQNITL